MINELEDILQSNFEIPNLGTAHFILGIQLVITKQGISLNQNAYVNKVLERIGMLDCHPVGTPFDLDKQLRKEQQEETVDDPITYQSIIGSLMYACIGTRPDLAHAVTLLSQFSSCLNKTHLAAAKRVLRYLEGTSDWKLNLPSKNDFILYGFTDSSYRKFMDDRKSYSGYILRLGEATISLCSRKQKTVALSTTEAEYMAMSNAACHIIWMHNAFLSHTLAL